MTRHRVKVVSGRAHYPFAFMSRGDHFTVSSRYAKRASAAAWMYGRRNGWRFTCREYGNKGRLRVTRGK